MDQLHQKTSVGITGGWKNIYQDVRQIPELYQKGLPLNVQYPQKTGQPRRVFFDHRGTIGLAAWAIGTA
jgi:hypothetical protein